LIAPRSQRLVTTRGGDNDKHGGRSQRDKVREVAARTLRGSSEPPAREPYGGGNPAQRTEPGRPKRYYGRERDERRSEQCHANDHGERRARQCRTAQAAREAAPERPATGQVREGQDTDREQRVHQGTGGDKAVATARGCPPPAFGVCGVWGTFVIRRAARTSDPVFVWLGVNVSPSPADSLRFACGIASKALRDMPLAEHQIMPEIPV
jgi:hypothetical protein